MYIPVHPLCKDRHGWRYETIKVLEFFFLINWFTVISWFFSVRYIKKKKNGYFETENPVANVNPLYF